MTDDNHELGFPWSVELLYPGGSTTIGLKETLNNEISELDKLVLEISHYSNYGGLPGDLLQMAARLQEGWRTVRDKLANRLQEEGMHVCHLPPGLFPIAHPLHGVLGVSIRTKFYDDARALFALWDGIDVPLIADDYERFAETYTELSEIAQIEQLDNDMLANVYRRTLSAAANSRLESLVEEKEAEFGVVRDAIREKQGFASLDTLWDDLVKHHRRAYKLYGVAFAAGIAAAAFVLLYIPFWARSSADVRLKQSGTELAVSTDIWVTLNNLVDQSGTIVVPAVLIVWGLRMLSRQYLYNIALFHDAQMRKAVTNAYLTLKTEDAIPDSTTALIMATIFGPRTAPVIKDGSPIESITEIANGVKETVRDIKPGKK